MATFLLKNLKFEIAIVCPVHYQQHQQEEEENLQI
jgi:hypothetical protein